MIFGIVYGIFGIVYVLTICVCEKYVNRHRKLFAYKNYALCICKPLARWSGHCKSFSLLL